jgi:hypothetical protein
MRQWRAHAAVLRGSSRGGNAAQSPAASLSPGNRSPIRFRRDRHETLQQTHDFHAYHARRLAHFRRQSLPRPVPKDGQRAYASRTHRFDAEITSNPAPHQTYDLIGVLVTSRNYNHVRASKCGVYLGEHAREQTEVPSAKNDRLRRNQFTARSTDEQWRSTPTSSDVWRARLWPRRLTPGEGQKPRHEPIPHIRSKPRRWAHAAAIANQGSAIERRGACGAATRPIATTAATFGRSFIP